MRRFKYLIIISTLISMLCSCSEAELTSAFVYPTVVSPCSSSQPSSSTDLSEETAQPYSLRAVVMDNEAHGEDFRAFLSENYQKLSDAFFGGISGIGFADLDMDGGIEMLIFDAGASTAMGIQFFDIIDGSVECVSANMDAVGTTFGGEHMSDVVVNANAFDSFRLVEDISTGEKFYVVQSGNGASDFSYSELVRFGSDNGVLTLTSIMYKHEDYDINNGDVTGENFIVDGKGTNRFAYEFAYSKFFAGVTDTGYVAKGVFMWENSDYELSFDGLMAMADKALALYEVPENS